MGKIKELNIENFRGIKILQLRDMQRVNVILGNNNCGKSSVLEAILILLGAAKPILPIQLNDERSYDKFHEDSITLFFHQLDLKTKINIKAKFGDESERELYISYFEDGKVTDIPLKQLEKKNLSTDSLIKYGLKYEYKDKEKKYNSEFIIQKLESKRTFFSSTTEHRSERGKASYLAPRYNFNNSIRSFNKIITDKEKENVLEIMRQIEPRIKDIAVVGDTVMVDVGLKKMIPLNVLGDGTRKLFTLIIAMYDVRGGTLLIDEIDNGLYYKSIKSLWNTLLKTSSDLGVQIFASTHSIDSLNALKSELTEELSDFREDVKIYTLRKDNEDIITSYSYDYEMFNHVLNQEVEIR